MKLHLIVLSLTTRRPCRIAQRFALSSGNEVSISFLQWWENFTHNALVTLNRTDIQVTSTARLHVHIGMEGRNFTVAEVKRISQYVMIFERKPIPLCAADTVAAFDRF